MRPSDARRILRPRLRTTLLVGIGSNQAGQHRASQEGRRGRPTDNDPLLDEIIAIAGTKGQLMSPESSSRIRARRATVDRCNYTIGHGRRSSSAHQKEPLPAAGIPPPCSRPSSSQSTRLERSHAVSEHEQDTHGQQEGKDPNPGGQPSDKKRKMPSPPAQPPAQAAPSTIPVDPIVPTQKRQKRPRFKPPQDPPEAQEALEPTPKRPRRHLSDSEDHV